MKRRDLVDAAISGWFAERDHDRALKVRREAGATVGPIYAIADIAADPHFAEREIVIDIEDDQFGSLPMHHFLPRLSARPAAWRRPAPELGEQRSEALEAAGIDPAILVAEVAA